MAGVDRASHAFQCLHDHRVVRTFEVQISALVTVILVSWGIALIEYCFAVPANRIGHGTYSAAELKTIQEVITLVVFAVFSVVVLKEAITVNHLVGFTLIVAGAFFVFKAPL
jgi:uncharacterized protein (DUF486 family)